MVVVVVKGVVIRVVGGEGEAGGAVERVGADLEGKSETVAAEERRETVREEKLAGTVLVPVAATMAGSVCWRSHSMDWPSDLWPTTTTLAAHVAGMRILRPRPSTLVCLSLVDFL